MRYRTIEYNRSGTTSYTEFDDYDEACTRLDDGVEAGCLTGGDIEEYVDGIGWVISQN